MSWMMTPLAFQQPLPDASNQIKRVGMFFLRENRLGKKHSFMVFDTIFHQRLVSSLCFVSAFCQCYQFSRSSRQRSSSLGLQLLLCQRICFLHGLAVPGDRIKRAEHVKSTTVLPTNMVVAGGFYVVLPSTTSVHAYPNNRPGGFRVD